jgi:hypothetical protein
VKNFRVRVRAVGGALMVGCAMLPLLSGCAIPFYHRHNKDAGCREKPFSLNTVNRPALKVPDGMDAPDTRNAIRVPSLDTPEHLRAKNEPCLSKPPEYFAGSGSKPGSAPGALPDGPLPPPVPAPTPAAAPGPDAAPPSSVPDPPHPVAPSPDAPK